MPYEIGVQSFTYREFSLEKCITEAARLGLQTVEIWPSHFTSDWSNVRIEHVKKQLQDAAIRCCGIGTVRLFIEEAQLTRIMDICQILEADYLTSTYDPANPEYLERAVALAQARGVTIALHNHGPDDPLGQPEAVYESVKPYPVDVVGACVDTGHYLRAGRTPEEVIQILGDRVHGLHLKDFIDTETEVEPGNGKLNFPTFLEALKQHTHFHSALVFEYEAAPQDPSPPLAKAISRLQQTFR